MDSIFSTDVFKTTGRALGVSGVIVLAISTLSNPWTSFNLPLYLALALAALSSERLSRDWSFPGKSFLRTTDFFIFMVMLLCNWQSAVILAAGLALVRWQAKDDEPAGSRFSFSMLSSSSPAVLATASVAGLLSLSYGSISALPRAHVLLFINAICLSALLKCGVEQLTFGLPPARKKAFHWRAAAVAFMWSAIETLGCFLFAGFVARIFQSGTSVLSVGATALSMLAIILFKENGGVLPEQENHTPTAMAPAHFRAAFDSAAIGMALVAPDGEWIRVNRSLCQLVGYSESELLQLPSISVVHPDDLPHALGTFQELLKDDSSSCQIELRYVHKLGREVWILLNGSVICDDSTRRKQMVFQMQDITERKQSEARLLHDAFHDLLTGLPNRALFMEHLRTALGRAQRKEEVKFAVFYLDLDRFKVINDSLGHMIGDQLLVGTARRLERCLRPGDTVARLGGDEFTVLIEELRETEEIFEIATRLQKELATPFNLGGREVFTTSSMGIALGNCNYERPDDILRDADTAMYRAKSSGKARFELFDEAMHTHAVNLLQLETDLRRAVEREEFFIQYQPIVALDNFSLRGFEALVRWRQPERGLISPADFISVAEDNGTILQIGHWVLHEACRQMKQWQERYPSDPPLFISVNLSGKQFTQPDLISQIEAILKETGVEPQSLKLEITESVVMENIETATAMLRELRALGVQLSIDDFGTGYSSLSYLHRFPINTLKIDRSFVTRIAENNENAEIVRTIVMLAQNLEMDVVAEGVENNEQLALLRRLNCENGQGYFFSRPVGTAGAEKIISDTYHSPIPEVQHIPNPRPFLKVLVN